MNNVLVLAIAQMVASSGITVIVILGSIVAAELAPNPGWATVPVSLAIIAVALTSIPAALLMRRVGRRAGFMLGASVGVCGGVVAAQGIASAHFALFCVAAIMLGCAMAFTQQYRFAAAEGVAPEQASRAVSYVLIGSLGAAIIGPQVALAARWWVADAQYAGSFLAVSLLYGTAIIVLSRLHVRTHAGTQAHVVEPSARELLTHSGFRTAVFASAAAYAVMSFIMTAAPISMHMMDHHSVETTTWVIQSHVLAMYLPSLFSGRIVARLGERTVMIWGGTLLAACAAVSLTGHHVGQYWGGLVLLGIGWNLLFVSGTTLLARCVRGAGRHRAQAINDFTVFGSQACASLLAGLAVQQVGWQTLNILTVPLLALMMLTASRLQTADTRATVPVGIEDRLDQSRGSSAG